MLSILKYFILVLPNIELILKIETTLCQVFVKVSNLQTEIFKPLFFLKYRAETKIFNFGDVNMSVFIRQIKNTYNRYSTYQSVFPYFLPFLYEQRKRKIHGF